MTKKQENQKKGERRWRFDKNFKGVEASEVDVNQVYNVLSAEVSKLELNRTTEYREAFDEFANLIGEEISKISQILGLEIPEVRLDNLPPGKFGEVLSFDKNILRIDVDFFTNFVKNISKKEWSKSHLKFLIAHELFHFYILKFYQRAADKTGQANKMEEMWDYPLDRGELACNLFAVQYLKQKSNKGIIQSIKDRIMARKLSKFVKEDRERAKELKIRFDQEFGL